MYVIEINSLKKGGVSGCVMSFFRECWKITRGGGTPPLGDLTKRVVILSKFLA